MLLIHVSAKCGSNGIEPAESGVVRVRVTAAAVEGAANAAVVKLLADKAGVPKSAVEIKSGQTSRRKRVIFHGLNARELERRFGLADGDA